MEEKQLRRRYRFYGRVQGVGFRWVTQMAASGAGATGLVRNEYDGSVTMEIQGTEAVIDRVVQTLENARYIRIYGKECQAIALVPNERGFRVRY